MPRKTQGLSGEDVDAAYAAGYKSGWEQPDYQGTDLPPYTTLHEIWWLGWKHAMKAVNERDRMSETKGMS